MAFQTKVYIVQRADKDGRLLRETPIAAKLTFGDAMKIAVMHGVAPAKITMIIADKSWEPNGEGQIGHHSNCKPREDDSRRKPYF
jgi:hypothetical protein